MDSAQAMQNKRTVIPLKEHDISSLQRTFRFFEPDRVPSMDEKWSHTVPCNDETDLTSFFCQLTQNAYIFPCIYLFHGLSSCSDRHRRKSDPGSIPFLLSMTARHCLSYFVWFSKTVLKGQRPRSFR